MADMTIEALEKEVDAIAARYEADFAGQSRATRDLALLETLTQRLRTALGHLEKQGVQPGETGAGKLLTTVRSRIEVYVGEQAAIKEAREAGPDAVDFARMAAMANFVFARYGRHFAEQPRDSRDGGLLRDMIDELKSIRQRMKTIHAQTARPAFQRDLDLVGQVIEQYEGEYKEIERAYASGSADEQASRLAHLANLQFELYQTHFVEQSRLTRRPALLQRMVENLRRISTAMRNLRPTGQAAEHNKQNITLVDQNLKHNESELVEIRKARQNVKLPDIMGMLGGAANEVFEAYRKDFAGKDRSTVSLPTLHVLCDKLGEIARQMAELRRAEASEMNDKNLDIVIDQLGNFEEEWRASKAAQTKK